MKSHFEYLVSQARKRRETPLGQVFAEGALRISLTWTHSRPLKEP